MFQKKLKSLLDELYIAKKFDEVGPRKLYTTERFPHFPDGATFNQLTRSQQLEVCDAEVKSLTNAERKLGSTVRRLNSQLDFLFELVTKDYDSNDRENLIEMLSDGTYIQHLYDLKSD